MRPIIQTVGTLAISLFIGMSGFAQIQNEIPAEKEEENKISEQEFKQFASALKKVQTVSQESQSDMVEAVQSEELTVERYNEILKSQKAGDAETVASSEEKESVEIVTEKIQKIQGETEAKMVTKIEETGLSLERYQEISALVQKDPTLQQKLQTYMGG